MVMSATFRAKGIAVDLSTSLAKRNTRQTTPRPHLAPQHFDLLRYYRHIYRILEDRI